jgi:glycosyltransferase involved in cell wall biosynthesis
MSKILWLGDAGCHTGFARVTHAIGERLVRDHGHEVHVLAVNYDGDDWPTNMHLYVANKLVPMDIYGQSRYLEMLGKVEPDVVVFLNDPYPIMKFLFRNNWDPKKILLQYRPILAYMPVDGINYPTTWDVLKTVTRPVVMSEFGRTWAPDADLALHGVDTETFRPATEARPLISSGGAMVRSKKDAKRALGYDPDGFLIVRVDRNSRRKDFSSTWKALVPVMKRHKDIQVHFHCKPTGDDGVELPQLYSREPDIANRFFSPGDHDTRRGWEEVDLVVLYNAADLVVSTSWGEGFGLTNAEALSCGTPVIAQNVSSITEVVGPGGVLIDPVGTVTVTSGHDQWLPDVPAFTDAVEHLYTAGGTRKKLGAAGREHVKAKFSWDEAARTFDRVITELAATVADNGEEDAGSREAEGTPPGSAVQDHVGRAEGVHPKGRGR